MSTVLEPIATPKTSQTNMAIRIYNTLTKQKETFEPVQPGKVGIYLCGPTVYKEAHIGHMVGPVIFDCIKRYLTYNGYDVNWVVNITDVDDKLIAQSQERGISMSQVATEMTMDYCANLLAMGVDQITHMPKATENMDEIIQFISNLIDKDYAYAVEGDVFFDVGRDNQYGKLSNRSADDQQGEGGGAAAKKRSPSDFALWKSAKSGEPSWDSPWGPGRPGWHIECSAMSRRILGETFDIHGGGLDLVFPHHENEVAQSECCHGKPMAKYWMHNGLMRSGAAGKVGGRGDREANADEAATADAEAGKISRSKGAGGLRTLIAKQGGERIRFFLMRTHYRSTIVFNEEGIEEAATGLEKFYTLFERYERINGRSFYLQPDADDEDRALIRLRSDGQLDADTSDLLGEIATYRDKFLAAMDDDFNSGAAVSELFQILSALNKFVDEKSLEDTQQRQADDLASFNRAVETLRELSALLGLFMKPAATQAAGGNEELTDGLAQLLIKIRQDARANKDFSTADGVRDGLTALGVVLEDRKEGTTWKVE
ncbi:MAG TPA: cysteine--tRNA ligase [Planctomycetaceae bacterium]|nr:cysteine--tRNA ligase [Blastopirellula sp.]HAY82428.1 cysteine--tRNA ligase [Planctomycetaceae bacterium]